MAEGLRNPYKRRTRHKDKITHITLSTDAIDYNLRDVVGDGPVNVRLTVVSGVVIFASTPTTIAFQTGTMNQKSSVYITNNGTIIGAGGVGANGGPGQATDPGTPTAASDGGDAMTINLKVTIENNGIIYAGGGGGGGGGGAGSGNLTGGGGGGGGAGVAFGVGGGGGAGSGGAGLAGATGTPTNGGTGGDGGSNASGITAGNGGLGGGPAQAGASGFTTSNASIAAFAGGQGGAAGVAINLNGNIITWVTGNTASQIKGAQV